MNNGNFRLFTMLKQMSDANKCRQMLPLFHFKRKFWPPKYIGINFYNNLYAYLLNLKTQNLDDWIFYSFVLDMGICITLIMLNIHFSMFCRTDLVFLIFFSIFFFLCVCRQILISSKFDHQKIKISDTGGPIKVSVEPCLFYSLLCSAYTSTSYSTIFS